MLVTLKHIKALLDYDYGDGMMSCHSPREQAAITWGHHSNMEGHVLAGFIPQLISNFAHVAAKAKCVDCPAAI